MILFNRETIKMFCAGIGSLLSMLAPVLFISVPIAVSAQNAANPGFWIPPVVNIANVGGEGLNVAGDKYKKLLSVGANGSYADLYDKDDNSGRQRWVFQRSSDGVSYNILVDGGTPADRKYLSVNRDASRVDLYDRDDGSGRQRWIVEKVPNSALSSQPGNDKYCIKIKGGVTNTSKYLSVTSDGSKVDLYHTIDSSRRQLWDFAVPQGITFNIQIGGGVTSGRTLLSTPSSLTSVDLYDKDDNSGRQRWMIKSSPHYGYQRIFMKDKCLTFGTSIGTLVTPVMLNPASNCGLEYNVWAIEDIGSGYIHIKPGNNWNGQSRYLSTTTDGGKVDLFNRDDGSGRQRWKLTIVR
jgi:hypothetical protein